MDKTPTVFAAAALLCLFASPPARAETQGILACQITLSQFAEDALASKTRLNAEQLHRVGHIVDLGRSQCRSGPDLVLANIQSARAALPLQTGRRMGTRFSDFWPTPARLKAHWQQLKHGQTSPHPGHNPFGALMMLALWAVVLGLGISGYLMGTDRFWGDDAVEAIHETLADGLMVLVGLHIAAALLMSYLEKTNLVRAMITGVKKRPD